MVFGEFGHWRESLISLVKETRRTESNPLNPVMSGLNPLQSRWLDALRVRQLRLLHRHVVRCGLKSVNLLGV
jgi:hypothetical protein